MNYNRNRYNERAYRDFFDDSDMSKFYGGIFEQPSCNMPFTDTERNQTKKILSISHLSIVLYFVFSYAALFILSLLINLIPPSITGNETMSALINMLLNAIPQYAFGFPAFLILISTVKKAPARDKKKMDIKEFLSLLCITQFFSIVGSYISTFLSSIIEPLIGSEVQNDLTTILYSTPLWMLIIFVVIIGPIFEELIFRKLLMDRLFIFGEKTAILLSSVAFGFFHGNLYQIFYATLLGLILGFIYTKTRNVKYSILMHMIINLLGTVVVVFVSDYVEDAFRILEEINNNGVIDPSWDLTPMWIVYGYSMAQLILTGLGIFFTYKYIKERRISLSKKCEIKIPNEEKPMIFLKNPGVIIYYVCCIILIVLSLIQINNVEEIVPDVGDAIYKVFKTIR